MLEFWIKTSRPLKVLESTWKVNTHTHPFNGPFPGLPRWAGTRKVKPVWILLKQETVSGSGISRAVCKSTPRFRQITMPAPTTQFFTGQMPFLRPTNSVKALKTPALKAPTWKVLELKSCKFFFKFCICWQFWSKHLYACHQYLETVRCIWFHFCLLTYLIKILTVRTVHSSVTLQSHFWMSTSRIWLFFDNFGAWKMQFGSLKVLEFLLWVCYKPWVQTWIAETLLLVICSHFNEMSKYQEKVAGGMHGSRPRTVSSPIPLQRSPRPVSPG